MDLHPYDIVCHDTTHHDTSRPIYGSKLLPSIFFSMLYTLDPCFEILIFTSVSMISTSMVFTDGIILGKLIVLIENNYGYVAKMISSSSFVMPF
jgi:hypothetical protein